MRVDPVTGMPRSPVQPLVIPGAAPSTPRGPAAVERHVEQPHGVAASRSGSAPVSQPRTATGDSEESKAKTQEFLRRTLGGPRQPATQPVLQTESAAPRAANQPSSVPALQRPGFLPQYGSSSTTSGRPSFLSRMFDPNARPPSVNSHGTWHSGMTRSEGNESRQTASFGYRSPPRDREDILPDTLPTL